jgi:dienelactone hydrolase
MTENITFTDLTSSMMQFYENGKFTDALTLVEKHMSSFPNQTTRITFWRMCLLSLCNRTEDVIAVFRSGLDSGIWWEESQFNDTDLDAVRDLSEFRSLMAVSQEKYEEARKQIGWDQTILLPDKPVSGKYPLLIVMHGRNGNKDSHIEYWDTARRKGWLVLSIQSTQPLSSNSYCWDNLEQGLADIFYCVDKVFEEYLIDDHRVITAGFSQGSGMAIYTGLSGKVNVHGFIGTGTVFREQNLLTSIAEQKDSLRGYFIIGEKDYSLKNVREIQKILRNNNIQFDEEVHSDMGHEFPPDFEKSFDKAIDFIFKEKE